MRVSFVAAGLAALISIGAAQAIAGGTKAAQADDARRLAVIVEAREFYKKKQYAKAKEVLERDTVPWQPDKLFARRQRLLAQVLIRMKSYGEARHANLEALRTNPALTDAVYDNSCASALEGRDDDAVRQLEILWHMVSGKKKLLERYSKLLEKDRDFDKVRTGNGFRRMIQAFKSANAPASAAGYRTDPSVFASVGEDAVSGFVPQMLLSQLLCGPIQSSGLGIRLNAPGRVFLHTDTLRLPVCFSYGFRPKDAQGSGKKKDLSFRFDLTTPAGKVLNGVYRPELNFRKKREALVSSPQSAGPPGGSVDGGAAFFSGGTKITDVSWHVGKASAVEGRWKLRVYNDVYQSETREIHVTFEKP